MSNATSGKGVRLQRGDGATTEVFTTIAEVGNISWSAQVAEIDVSSLDSTAKEKIAGLLDNGDVKLDFHFLGSNVQQKGCRTDFVAGTKRNFKLLLNDGTTTPTTFAFSGFFKAFDVTVGGVNDPIKGSATIAITGSVTITDPT